MSTGGQVLSPSNPFSGTQQAQVLERLGQLRQWQKQQQDQIFMQQQIVLQGITASQDKEKRVQQQILLQDITQDKEERDITSNDSYPGDNNRNHAPLSTGNNPLQPEGHTISGSSLHSNDSGMLTGQSSATDVKYALAIEEPESATLCGSSGFQTPESHGISDVEDDLGQAPLSTKVASRVPHDEIPVNPGIGPGSAATFEELLEKKLQQYQTTPPRFIGHAPSNLIQCPSEESFVVRGNERQKVEEAELQEFELLERATHDTSFSSQCSLVARVLNRDPTAMVSSSPKSSRFTRHSPGKGTSEQNRETGLSPVHESGDDDMLPWQSGVSRSDWPLGQYSGVQSDLWTQSHSHPSPQSHFHSQSHSQTHSHPSPQSQSHFHSQTHSHAQVWPQLQFSSLPSLVEEEESKELDSTLKQSDKFNDEEAWESFAEDTPKRKVAPVTHEIHSDSGDSTDIAANNRPVPFPVKTGPVRKMRVLNEPANDNASISHNPTPLSDFSLTNDRLPQTTIESEDTGKDYRTDIQRSHLYNPELPPPSALVAKLFPSLRKERDNAKSKYLQAVETPPKHISHQRMPVPVKTTPIPLINNGNTPASNVGLDEQVKDKLDQLESEITRFKEENTALDVLRKEREEMLSKLKQEIGEFERQREEQIKEFEEYRFQEIKKLKKERKIFESFQREANTTKDKKMKDDLILLKQEMEELQDELRSKESRWSSTLSRYRIRIDKLESQNAELQNDLRVMEEQRLLWWQQQLEVKRSPLGVSRKSPKRLTSLSPSIQNQSFGSENGNKTEKPKTVLGHSNNKQRRKSDPPLSTIKNKENKRPTNRIHGSTPSLNVPNKPIRKPSSIRGSKVKPAKHNGSITMDSKVLPQFKDDNLQRFGSISSIDEADNEQLPVTNNEGDEVEIVEVRGIEYERDIDTSTSDSELSDRAEEIVANILNTQDKESERLTTSETRSARQHATPASSKSVRFLNLSSSEGPSPELPLETRNIKGATTEQCLDVPTDQVDKQVDQEEHIEDDGTRVILFPNGTKKMMSMDGLTSTVYFFNGDIKRIMSDGSIVYVYRKCGTTHKTLNDGNEIIEFSNGQVETRYANGEKAIKFPDGTVRHVYPNGEEKVTFANGTVQYVHSNGDKTIEFTDGQREIHSKNYKQREYPDGTVKTVYPDGRQETRYSNGRVKIKDRDGVVLLDNAAVPQSTSS